MAEESLHESPVSSERPRWYRTSFVFVLLCFQMFSAGMPLLGIIAMLLAIINTKNDDWYKHRWPWFIVALLSITLFMSLITFLIAISNPDPVVPIHQGVMPSVSVSPNIEFNPDGFAAGQLWR